MSYDIAALQLLGNQGIFRKYELVLELGCGLGARARWASEHFGCRVVGVEPSPVKSYLAARWNHKSRSRGVGIVCGALDCLPVSTGAVTHAWWLPGELVPKDRVLILSEVCRVLRDGGFFATMLNEPTREEESAWLEELQQAGFAIQETRRILAHPRGELIRLAERRLMQDLARSPRQLALWLELTGPRAEQSVALVAVLARRRPRVLVSDRARA